MVNEVVYFSKLSASFAKWDQDSLSWKTSQRCLLEGWETFSAHWPRSGLMQNGIAYRLAPLVPRISATGCSYWVTPTAVEGRRGSQPGRPHDTGYPLAQQVLMPHRWPTPTATDGRKWNAKTEQQRRNQGSSVRLCNKDRGDGTPIGGALNPTWVEWLMGFPPGWTDLEDSETQSSPKSQNT